MIYVGDKLSVNGGVAQANTTTQAPHTTAQASNTQTKQTTTYAPKMNTAPSQSASTSNVGSSSAKEWIAQKESGGSYTASNPSGAYGKYQLKSYNLKYGTSPAGQERAANEYVQNRYSSWDNAKSFWLQHGWY